MRNLRYLCSLVMLAAALCCGSAAAAPEAGWWWNPAESGRGFFIESQDGIFFLGGYFYEDDGHARWLVAGGDNADPYHYTGPLYAQSSGQSLYGTYSTPSAPAGAGMVTAAFSDDTHGTITWPGGTISIVRYSFGTGTPDFQPFTGWWWNPAESGSGYSVELQGDTIFIVGYMYETDGRPVWYLSAGKMSSPIDLLRTAAAVRQRPDDGRAVPATIGVRHVGMLGVEFIAQDEANFTFSDAASTRAASHGGRRADPRGRAFPDGPGRADLPQVQVQAVDDDVPHALRRKLHRGHDRPRHVGRVPMSRARSPISGTLTFTQHLGPRQQGRVAIPS